MWEMTVKKYVLSDLADVCVVNDKSILFNGRTMSEPKLHLSDSYFEEFDTTGDIYIDPTFGFLGYAGQLPPITLPVCYKQNVPNNTISTKVLKDLGFVKVENLMGSAEDGNGNGNGNGDSGADSGADAGADAGTVSGMVADAGMVAVMYERRGVLIAAIDGYITCPTYTINIIGAPPKLL